MMKENTQVHIERLYPIRARESWSENKQNSCVDIVSGYGTIQLNRQGSFIWLLCDGKHSVSEIVDRAQQVFSGEDCSIREETQSFIMDCKTMGLLYVDDDFVQFDKLPLKRKVSDG